MGKGWNAACRALGLATLSLFAALAFSPLPNDLHRRLADPPSLQPAQAIVVLGAGSEADGFLMDHSLRRAVHGIRLHRRGLAPLLVLLGPGHREGPPEAAVRAELAQDLGVSRQAILLERGRTTREEAFRVRALLEPRSAKRILLVTGSHHMPRARRAFARAGFEVVAAPVDEYSSEVDRPESRLFLARSLLQELLARLYYRASGLP